MLKLGRSLSSELQPTTGLGSDAQNLGSMLMPQLSMNKVTVAIVCMFGQTGWQPFERYKFWLVWKEAYTFVIACFTDILTTAAGVRSDPKSCQLSRLGRAIRNNQFLRTDFAVVSRVP